MFSQNVRQNTPIFWVSTSIADLVFAVFLFFDDIHQLLKTVCSVPLDKAGFRKHFRAATEYAGLASFTPNAIGIYLSMARRHRWYPTVASTLCLTTSCSALLSKLHLMLMVGVVLIEYRKSLKNGRAWMEPWPTRDLHCMTAMGHVPLPRSPRFLHCWYQTLAPLTALPRPQRHERSPARG